MTAREFSREVFRRFPGATLAITALLLVASFLEMIGLAAFVPLLSQFLESSAIEQGKIGEWLAALGVSGLSFNALVLVLLAFLLARTAFLYWSQVVIGRLGVAIETDFKDRLMADLLRADWRFQLEQSAGTLANVVTRETENAGTAIQYLGRYYSRLVVAGVFFATSLLISWQGLLMVLVVATPMVAAGARINRLTRKVAVRRIAEANECNAQVIENTNLMKYIKGSALEEQTLARFRASTGRLARLKYKDAVYRSLVGAFPDFSGAVVVAVLLFVIYNFMPSRAGDMVFFALLLQRGVASVANLQTFRRSLMAHMPAYEACERLARGAGAARETGEGEPFPGMRQGVELHGVGFGYHATAPVLRDVSLSIPMGSIVAIAGRSGAGKTTLVDIVLGLLRPDRGAVMVDGKDLAGFDLGSWRARLAYVPQDPVLSRGTVRENIRWARPDAGDEEVRQAALLAHAHEFIARLPLGYETEVGDRGLKLSGGQKQRIALARALLRGAQLLVLDEATSALDPESEGAIRRALLELKGRLAIVLIAHRDSMLEIADRIYTLEGGAIAGQRPGSEAHHELPVGDSR